MKALPLSYNRDLQEDKEPLFHAVDTLDICLKLYCAMLPKIKFKGEIMAAAADQGFLNATDFADYLVGKGVAFRDAHHITGKVVAFALKKNREIHEIPLERLQSFYEGVSRDIYDALELKAVVNRRESPGGTATKTVKDAISKAMLALKKG
jgi:argininosuccinate lyase